VKVKRIVRVSQQMNVSKHIQMKSLLWVSVSCFVMPVKTILHAVLKKLFVNFTLKTASFFYF